MSGIIGTEPGQIPLNQFLSELAFMSRDELMLLLMGIGGSLIEVTSGPIQADRPTGFYQYTGGTSGGPYSPMGYTAIQLRRVNGENLIVMWTNTEPAQLFVSKRLGGTWGGWRKIYDSTSILGAVGQTGGIPNGAIIERGVNVNGEYIRWADGTQICMADINGLAVAANSFTTIGFALPAQFINTSYFFHVTAQPTASPDVYGFTYFTSKSTTGIAAVYRNGATAQSVSGRYLAIGRWF